MTTSGRPLVVCMLMHAFYPRVGGAESLVLSLSGPLAQRGVRTQVLTRREPGLSVRQKVGVARITRVAAPGARVAASLFYLVGSLLFLVRARRHLDVLHAHHLLSPTTTAALGGLLLRKPTVVTVHGLGADMALLRASKLGSLRLRFFRRVVRRFVAVSDEIERELLASGVPGNRVLRIPNGVDMDRFHPLGNDERAALRQGLRFDGQRVALFVGRLEAVKGLDCLLDAWPSVRIRCPDALLVVVGDGPEGDALRARGTEGVRFPGRISDPLPLLQSADCFVLPSRSEGTSIALLEALAVGLPCVATRVGGNADLLRGDTGASLVPADDAVALGSALAATLLTEEPPAGVRGRRARVLREHSLEHAADQWATLYRELASGAP